MAAQLIGARPAFCLQALRSARVVMFDVDSTVSPDEGIDVLAASLGKGEEVAEWTRKYTQGEKTKKTTEGKWKFAHLITFFHVFSFPFLCSGPWEATSSLRMR